jgi:BirA family biotin operon repressor/biotin-[acetyl-CoA-carboxylase] ligase
VGVAATGWEDLAPARVRTLLAATAFGRPYIFRETTGSTSDDARALAAAGAPEGAVVVADRQTAGRGRLGHVWHSPPSCNLYLSLVLRPAVAPARVAGLTLAVAVALAEAVEKLAPGPALLRWPNDVLLDGTAAEGGGPRKVAGVLTELEGDAAAVRHVVVGIGVNANLPLEDLPPDVAGIATSLQAARGGEAVDRGALLVAVLDRVHARYAQFVAEGLAPLRAAWSVRAPALGRTVEVREGDGGAPPWEGVAEGLDDDGALLVRLADGSLRRVVSGEVRER